MNHDGYEFRLVFLLSKWTFCYLLFKALNFDEFNNNYKFILVIIEFIKLQGY